MNAAKPQFNGPLAQFKVQRGKAAVQGSKFNAAKPQFKVQRAFGD